MATGIATSYLLVARLVAVAAASFLAGCGEQAQAPGTSGEDSGTGGAGGGSGSPGDAATDPPGGGGGSGGLVWDASDADGADGPVACNCQGSDYVINVVDGAETIALRYPFASPEISSYLDDCSPSTPAAFTTQAVQAYVDMTACAQPAEGRPCIQLFTIEPAGTEDGSYFDDGKGTVWKLTDVVIDAPGLWPPKVGSTISGTFSATATSATLTKSLMGSFSVCHAFHVMKPV